MRRVDVMIGIAVVIVCWGGVVVASDSLCVGAGCIRIGMTRKELRKELGEYMWLKNLTPDSTECLIVSGEEQKKTLRGFGRVGFDRKNRVRYAAKQWGSGGDVVNFDDLYSAMRNIEAQGLRIASVEMTESFEPTSSEKEIVIDYGKKKLRILELIFSDYKQVTVDEIMGP